MFYNFIKITLSRRNIVESVSTIWKAMNNIKLNYLKQKRDANTLRLTSEIEFAEELSKTLDNKYSEIIDEAVEETHRRLKENGAITKNDVKEIEAILMPMSPVCKSKTIMCVAHAHIDMNWMWSFDETVNITLSTFETMLKLMEEYPEFTFAQSQASVYRIVEEYAPEMLEKIRQRVKEGRWEVSASTWVETDNNMVNGEGLSRHMLYAKNYLMKLFDLPEDYFKLDFEPDTFGHNINAPEIMQKGGIKYLYHCRGKKVPDIFKWRAPSGSEVLCYREPLWYNSTLKSEEISLYPAIMAKYGLDKFLKVYGVGDHGGGATRRDLDRILDMRTWPIMPNFEFSSYAEFYRYIEQNAQNVETIEGELNYIFTGCYTTETRIKRANREGERLFFATEKISSYTDAMKLTDTSKVKLNSAWEKHLFNHFHDIIPGSGVTETREYALGKSQERNAELGVIKTNALKALGNNIDLSGAVSAMPAESTAEGAGVGFANKNGIYCGNACGNEVRPYLLYNYSDTEGDFVCDLTLWDYDKPADQIVVKDMDGKELPYEIIDRDPQDYWGHNFRRISVKAHMPANSYATVLVCGDKNETSHFNYDNDYITYTTDFNRQHFPAKYVLENDCVFAEFSVATGQLVKFTDKKTGKSMGDGVNGIDSFQFVKEDGRHGMTAWIVGRWQSVEPVGDVKIAWYKPDGLVRKFAYSFRFGNSDANVEISLREGSDKLDYKINVEFREFGVQGGVTPSLYFKAAVNPGSKYYYDVPYGVIERGEVDEDQVALSFVYAENEKGGVILSSDSKYGYRAYRDEIYVDLIRASSDPDKYPENYTHEINLALGMEQGKDFGRILKKAAAFWTPVLSVCIGAGKGKLPHSAQDFAYTDNVVLSSVKTAEDKSGRVFRFFEAEGKSVTATLTVNTDFSEAYLTDSCENIVKRLETDGKTVKIPVAAYSVVTVLVK